MLHFAYSRTGKPRHEFPAESFAKQAPESSSRAGKACAARIACKAGIGAAA